MEIEEIVDDEHARVLTCQMGEAEEGESSQLPIPEHLQSLYKASSEHLNESQQSELATLLSECSTAFAVDDDDMGRTNVVQHTIDCSDARPVCQRARRLPSKRRQELDDYVSRLLKQGATEHSSSPWASPLVAVTKKDGSTRFCVDYRELNAVTEKDAYPLPWMDDSLDSLGGNSFFCTVDLLSGYHQVEVAEKDRPKAAFTTGTGLYQYKVMPFGLSNAPAAFERLMELVLAGLHWKICLINLDDVQNSGGVMSVTMHFEP